MNIKAELNTENSKALWQRIANHIAVHPEAFDELMSCFLSSGEYRIAQRASNVVNICVERDPELIRPYLGTIIENLDRPIHDAVKRNTVRMLQLIDIPEEYLGVVADKCFRYLDSEREPVAVRAFAMTVLANITLKVPELKNELIMMIEDHLPYGQAAYKARAKHVLATLKKAAPAPRRT